MPRAFADRRANRNRRSHHGHAGRKLPIGKLSPKAKRYALTALSRRPGDEPLRTTTGVSSFSPDDLQRMAAAQQAEQAARKAEFARKRADVTGLPRLLTRLRTLWRRRRQS